MSSPFPGAATDGAKGGSAAKTRRESRIAELRPRNMTRRKFRRVFSKGVGPVIRFPDERLSLRLCERSEAIYACADATLSDLPSISERSIASLHSQ